MNRAKRIESPVKEMPVAVLTDVRREGVGLPTDKLGQLGADDPLVALLKRCLVEAQQAGISRTEVEAELMVYNSERRN